MLDPGDLSEAAAQLEARSPGQSALLTVPQAAHLLQVHERTVWRWIGDGTLTATRLTSRCTRISRATLDDFIRKAST